MTLSLSRHLYNEIKNTLPASDLTLTCAGGRPRPTVVTVTNTEVISAGVPTWTGSAGSSGHVGLLTVVVAARGTRSMERRCGIPCYSKDVKGSIGIEYN